MLQAFKQEALKKEHERWPWMIDAVAGKGGIATQQGRVTSLLLDLEYNNHYVHCWVPRQAHEIPECS